MKAVYISEFGGSLEYRDVPDPSAPEKNEVIVRVRAAGLNRADLLQARGLYAPPAGFSPNLPGMEFAGEIAECAEDVHDLKPGDRVMGITAGEGQAELVKVDASLLIRIPDRFSFAEAASIPEVFITADDAIFSQCGLKKGETILIHAVGSGVGLAAAQLAKASGATVIGTSRTSEKLERSKPFGVGHGICVSADASFSETVLELSGGRGADVILDLVGASYFAENLASLARLGRLILVGLSGGAETQFDMRKALYKRARIFATVLRPRSVEEKALAVSAFANRWLGSLNAGTLVPLVDRIYPAADVNDAYAYLASNESFGKVILEF